MISITKPWKPKIYSSLSYIHKIMEHNISTAIHPHSRCGRSRPNLKRFFASASISGVKCSDVIVLELKKDVALYANAFHRVWTMVWGRKWSMKGMARQITRVQREVSCQEIILRRILDIICTHDWLLDLCIF